MVLVEESTVTDAKQNEPGHVLAILVLGIGTDAAAVVTDLAVTHCDVNGGEALRVRGPVQVGEDTIRHYEDIVLPLLHRTTRALGIKPRSLTLSLTNLNAASLQDRGLTISGFSADAAFYVAALSALLGVPAEPGLAITGHIASQDGEVRMVRSLSAKLRAAVASPEVETALIPDPKADDSLSTLTPEEMTDIEEAIRHARDRITITPVRDVSDVLRNVFCEPNLVVAALRNGYFSAPPQTKGGIPAKTVLAGDLPNRYWDCLEEAIHGRDPITVENLLQSRVAYHVKDKTYPAGYGDELHRLLSSVPAGVRDSCLRFPLLPAQDALSMVRMASANDLNDLRRLLDALAGDRFHDGTAIAVNEARVFPPDTTNEHLAALLDAIDPDVLYRTVGAPIEAARASFRLETVTARNNQECLAVVTSFYVHMVRHRGTEIRVAEPSSLEGEAVDWLEKAFARQGGVKAAYAEARSGIRGRLKFILDVLTEEMRFEEEDKRRNWVFTKFLSGLEYEERVELVRAFMDLLAPHLQDEVLASPPERYVKHAEVLLRTYAQVSGRLKQLVRAM